MPRARTRDEVERIMDECGCYPESARVIQGFRWDIEDAEERAHRLKGELCAYYKKVLGEARMQAAD